MCLCTFLSWCLEQKHMPKIGGFFAFIRRAAPAAIKISPLWGWGSVQVSPKTEIWWTVFSPINHQEKVNS